MLIVGFFKSFSTPWSTFAKLFTPNWGHLIHLAALLYKANTKYLH